MPPSSYRSVPLVLDCESDADDATHPAWLDWFEEIRGACIASELGAAALPDPLRALLIAPPEAVLRGRVLSAYYAGGDSRSRLRAEEDGFIEVLDEDDVDVEELVARFAEALDLPLLALPNDQGWELRLGPHAARIRRVAKHARLPVRRMATAITVRAHDISAALNLMLATARDVRRVVPVRSAPGRSAFLPLRWAQATRLGLADQLACTRTSEWTELYDADARASGRELEPRGRAERQSVPPPLPRREPPITGARLAAISLSRRSRLEMPPPPVMIVEEHELEHDHREYSRPAALVDVAHVELEESGEGDAEADPNAVESDDEDELSFEGLDDDEPAPRESHFREIAPPPMARESAAIVRRDEPPKTASLDDAIARIAAIAARAPAKPAAPAPPSPATSINDALARLVRSEPLRSEPLRNELVRSDSKRSEPLRSEALRSELVREVVPPPPPPADPRSPSLDDAIARIAAIAARSPAKPLRHAPEPPTPSGQPGGRHAHLGPMGAADLRDDAPISPARDSVPVRVPRPSEIAPAARVPARPSEPPARSTLRPGTTADASRGSPRRG